MRSLILRSSALLRRAFFFCLLRRSSVMKKISVSSLILASLISTVLAPAACVSRETLRLATTTSLYDTGLWSYLEPMFEEKYGVGLDVIYAGSGKALEWGKRRDVDVIVVHDKAAELQFVSDGYGVERVPFAYNYFLIVGAASDPAGIKGMSPEEAFKRITEAGKANPQQVKFVSRGDNSGTHAREKAIWAAAGYSYEDVRNSGAWYVEGGNGMGPTLVMANEMKAYTLSDIGTFLAFKKKLTLVPLVEQGDVLLNVYSAIVVSKTENKLVVNNFLEFLTSKEIQDFIGGYGLAEYGRPLFTPCAGQDS